MIKTYWTLFILGGLGIILSILMILIVAIGFSKGRLSKTYFVVTLTVLLLPILLAANLLISCIKDFKYVSDGCYFEENATVVEFTYVKQHLDGNGQTQYSQPKFYLEEKDEYIVLNVANVEIGKKYRIRYLPNTKICEIVSTIQ